MDDDLLRRCQKGDHAALGELICRFEARLFRLAYRVLRNAAQAEDAVADAFVAIWARASKWHGDAAAGTWIHRVAYRVILDHDRARKRWWRNVYRSANKRPCEPTLPVSEADSRERQQHLESALTTLAPEDRALVHLHYFENQSLAEIALVLGISDALKIRLTSTTSREECREIYELI